MEIIIIVALIAVGIWWISNRRSKVHECEHKLAPYKIETPQPAPEQVVSQPAPEQVVSQPAPEQVVSQPAPEVRALSKKPRKPRVAKTNKTVSDPISSPTVAPDVAAKKLGRKPKTK